ncbi:MAG: RDD family protein [Flavobacteriaceae bacterium]|jgi:uncharacterized RDD family membrane protein YckC|nr:RDD family protein [Flavobacteriaceae bacterium]
MREYGIVEDNQASKWIRLANHIIDMIVYYLFIYVLAIFIIITRVGTSLSFLGNNFLAQLVFALFYALFMFGMETLLKGKSIGKIITGTKVVTEYGEKPTISEFLARSFSRIVPFEPFSFLGNMGWHDKWSNTRVVKEKSFNSDMMSISSIDEIGNAKDNSADINLT